MQHEVKKYLYDILQAVKDIEAFVGEADYPAYVQNSMLQAAVERKFALIGEAVNRIKSMAPEQVEAITDFERIIGFRNVIIHGYDVVDQEVVWHAIKENMPQLKTEVERLLNA